MRQKIVEEYSQRLQQPSLISLKSYLVDEKNQDLVSFASYQFNSSFLPMKKDLSRFIFNNLELTGADFSKTKLTHCTYVKAELNNAIFKEVSDLDAVELAKASWDNLVTEGASYWVQCAAREIKEKDKIIDTLNQTIVGIWDMLPPAFKSKNDMDIIQAMIARKMGILMKDNPNTHSFPKIFRQTDADIHSNQAEGHSPLHCETTIHGEVSDQVRFRMANVDNLPYESSLVGQMSGFVENAMNRPIYISQTICSGAQVGGSLGIDIANLKMNERIVRVESSNILVRWGLFSPNGASINVQLFLANVKKYHDNLNEEENGYVVAMREGLKKWLDAYTTKDAKSDITKAQRDEVRTMIKNIEAVKQQFLSRTNQP